MTPLGATVQVDAYPLVFQQKTLMGTSYGNAHPPRDIPRIADLYRASWTSTRWCRAATPSARSTRALPR